MKRCHQWKLVPLPCNSSSSLVCLHISSADRYAYATKSISRIVFIWCSVVFVGIIAFGKPPQEKYVWTWKQKPAEGNFSKPFFSSQHVVPTHRLAESLVNAIFLLPYIGSVVSVALDFSSTARICNRSARLQVDDECWPTKLYISCIY